MPVKFLNSHFAILNLQKLTQNLSLCQKKLLPLPIEKEQTSITLI